MDVLYSDFKRFQTLHSWYKHIPLDGIDFYVYQVKGEQARNGVHPQITDSEGMHWHFTYRIPNNIATPVYKVRFGPFLRGVEGSDKKHVWGIWIIRDIAGSAFDTWIINNYPEWKDVDWGNLDDDTSNPIVIELFRRESAKYWNDVKAMLDLDRPGG